MKKDKFWINKKLTELSHSEWEALCDNCGKCCVIKLQNEKNNEVFYTNISCKLLDTKNCKCTDYSNRKKIVPDCVKLTPNNLSQLNWMPNTCAYKLVNEEKKLPSSNDGRKSSIQLKDNLIDGLLESGVNVNDIGLVQTPLLYFSCIH